MKSLLAWIAAGLFVSSVSLSSAIAEDKVQEQKPERGTLASDSSDKSQGDQQDRRKESEEAKRLQDLFLRGQTVFIRKGEMITELNTFYFTDTRLELLPVGNGSAAPVKLDRRYFDTTLIGRYGLLTDGLELDVFVPAYVYVEQSVDTGVARSRSTSQGFGDVSAALRYQLTNEGAGIPSVIVDVETKSRTGGDIRGTGNWNVGGGVTLLKTIDPVVFFGRVGYTQTFGAPGRNLGDIIEYRIGAGFSLNDRVSFNTQVTGAFVGRSKLSTPGIGGAGNVLLTTQSLELMNLLFTATVLVTKKLFVEPVVGVALTDDAFDAIIGLRIPYRF